MLLRSAARLSFCRSTDWESLQFCIDRIYLTAVSELSCVWSQMGIRYTYNVYRIAIKLTIGSEIVYIELYFLTRYVVLGRGCGDTIFE